MLGKIFNKRYKIIKELGKGGMAIVFEANDLLLDRKVALKMLKTEYVNDKAFVKKFRQEAKSVAKLSHPNVVNIFDIGQDDKYHYLVMENIQGQNLKDIINERGRLTIIEALDIANQICAALNIAHSNNIIHCDIKPHNILITPSKQVKITDFGIARAVSSATMTITDTIIGSAHYFSPEQARGTEIKTHSDLYSLGIVLYEMLTGEVPFKGDSPISVALKHIQEKAKKPSLINPDIPQVVENIVMKAIAKKPEERFKDSASMRESITSALKSCHKKKKSSKIDSGNDETIILNKADFKDNKQKNVKKNNENKNKNKDINKNKKNQLKERQKQVSFKSEQKYLSQPKNSIKLNKWTKIMILVFFLLFFSVLGIIYFFQGYMDIPIVNVPELIGKEYISGKELAALEGLSIEQIGEAYHNSIPEGHIISQFPTAGDSVRQTRVISVTISKGTDVLSVPDLKEKSLREADIILTNLKLETGIIEYEYNEEIAENHIIRQSPEAKKEITVNDQIDLVVSKGAKIAEIKMPNLLGLNIDEAQTIITDNKLELGEVKEELSKRFLEGIIIDQKIAEGEQIPINTKIDLTISKGVLNPQQSQIHPGLIITIHQIPPGPNEQEVKIVLTDDHGRDIIYTGYHQVGEQVIVDLNNISVGPSRYEVFIDNQLIKDYKL